MAAGYGLDLDPWQRLVLDDWFAVGTDGRRAASTCWLSVPRQNGKTGITEAYALFALAILGERLLYTAQELPGARRLFSSLLRWFGRSRNDRDADNPELNALVEKVSHTNGREGIYLVNGGRMEFSARTGRVFRGGSIDALLLDEAQLHTDEYHEALGPALRASPDAQKIFLGTPPDAAHSGELFARMRNALVEGVGQRLAAAEWSPDPELDPYSLDAARQSNPALGIRVSWSDMQEAAANNEYSLEGYQRELLGSWTAGAGFGRVIPADVWQDRTDTGSVPAEQLTLGVEVAPDQAGAVVSLAGRRADDVWHIELLEQKTGVAWLVPMVAEYLRLNPALVGVVADAGSPAAALLPEFQAAGVQVTTPKVADLGVACSSLLAGLVAGQVVHTGQPQLGVAAATAGKRPLGNTGMWVWSRKNEAVDITPIQAVTWALWAAQGSAVRPYSVRAPARRRRKVVVLSG